MLCWYGQIIREFQTAMSSVKVCFVMVTCVVVVISSAFGYKWDLRQKRESLKSDPKQNLPQSNVQVHYNETNGNNLITTITLDIDFVQNTTETSIITEEAPFCGCYCGIPNRKHRIIGGNETKPHEFPWMAAMYRKDKFYCAGALITRRHVLTAAHCVYGFNHKEIKVVLGEHDRTSTTEAEIFETKVKKTTPHSGFDLYTFNNDVAVVELETPVTFGPTIRAACLPERAGMNYTARMGIIAGWGRTGETKPTSGQLRATIVPIMSEEECSKAGYKGNRVTENMLCAGYIEGKIDACQGDSGGPLLIETIKGNLEIAGVVSWGRGCARPNYPGVYARVSKFLPWIQEQVTNDCYCSRP